MSKKAHPKLCNGWVWFIGDCVAVGQMMASGTTAVHDLSAKRYYKKAEKQAQKTRKQPCKTLNPTSQP